MKIYQLSTAPKWLLATSITVLFFTACRKEINQSQQESQIFPVSLKANAEKPPFNIEVILRGEDDGFGHVRFRQDNDVEKIINLDVWVRDLEPNHEYLMQRAVDAMNVVDGTCVSTSWLTLGKGLIPQSILTNESGTGSEALWRSVAAIPSGSAFDIHFRVVDAISMEVVLTSDCYKYIVR
jgi:hypothetical protein